MKELLLHICCAPCGGGCLDHPLLVEHDCRVAGLFFSNSNLDRFEEYEKRLTCVRQLAEKFKLEVIADPYDHAAWRAAVAGFENEPEHGERCRRCFRFNLARTAMLAKRRNLHFATTLTVSPQKSSRVIFEEGTAWEEFVPLDFKKRDGYKKGCDLAREMGFYRQNYCGCEFSRSHLNADGTLKSKP